MKFLRTIFIGLMLAGASIIAPQTAFAWEKWGGQSCMPILIPQSVDLSYTKAGVTNISPTRSLWVNCPVNFTADTAALAGNLLVYATSEVTCTYREIANDATQQQIATNTTDDSSAHPGLKFGFWSAPWSGYAHADPWINVACFLTPGTTLVGLKVF